jgi:hypothetical protein
MQLKFAVEVSHVEIFKLMSKGLDADSRKQGKVRRADINNKQGVISL